MPTYEYRCRSCGHSFDIVQKMSDASLTHCPECGGELRKVFAPPAISFKGSGFYVTDHGKKAKPAPSGDSSKKEPAAKKDSSDGGSGSSSGGDGGSGSDGKTAGTKKEEGVVSEAEIGVFGGSGFYSFLEDPEEIALQTPYGPPSAPVTVGTIEGRRVAFIPRHGTEHEFPPHLVPYRANVWAMKELGVTRLFGPSAAGSLRRDIPPKTFVVSDQAIDFTKTRQYTFFDGPVTTHVSLADPYCPEMRSALIAEAGRLGIEHRDGGTMAVIEGPRFSTRAESKMFAQVGGDVVGMTQFPEVTLAREAELCYANIALVTDYDVGLDDIAPVSHHEVMKVFGENIEALRTLLFAAVPALPAERGCECGQALAGSH